MRWSALKELLETPKYSPYSYAPFFGQSGALLDLRLDGIQDCCFLFLGRLGLEHFTWEFGQRTKLFCKYSHLK
jgi:hypothetical protein